MENNILKRSLKTQQTTAPMKDNSLSAKTAACVSEMMNAGTSLHKLHLKVTGLASYAAHKALNKIYDAFPEHADDLAEEYQGAAEELLVYQDVPPKSLQTVEEGLQYLRDMKDMVTNLQSIMPYSEIVNSLDTAKSSINSAKYKLLFLK